MNWVNEKGGAVIKGLTIILLQEAHDVNIIFSSHL
jgi:hypothetical protein